MLKFYPSNHNDYEYFFTFKDIALGVREDQILQVVKNIRSNFIIIDKSDRTVFKVYRIRNSKNTLAFGYDKRKRELLTITKKDGIVVYTNVVLTVYERLKKSKSISDFITKNINKKHVRNSLR